MNDTFAGSLHRACDEDGSLTLFSYEKAREIYEKPTALEQTLAHDGNGEGLAWSKLWSASEAT